MIKKSKNLKRNKAITLVALIITIIILLILATVSISLIINSGILEKAKYGVDKYSEEEEFEKVQLAVMSAQLKGNGFLTTESLNKELQAIFGGNKEAIETSVGWFYQSDKGYRIYKNGNVEEGNLLPDEYQQVEYIGSTGIQYINTNYKHNSNTKYIISAKYPERAGYNSIIGSRSYGEAPDAFDIGRSGKKIYSNIGAAQGNIFSIEYNTLYIITVTTARVILNDLVYNTGKTTITESKFYDYLFAINNNGNVYEKAAVTLYGCEIYDNDLLVRNFIPCKRKSDDKSGLYDTVEGKFYTNQGTGEFIKGPDV